MLLAARSAPGSGDINQTAKKLLQKLLITRPTTTREQQQVRRWQQSRNHPSHSPSGGSRDTARRPGNILPHTLQKSPFIAKSAVSRKIGNNRPLPGEARQQHSAAALRRTLRWRGEHKVRGYRYVSATLLLTASLYFCSVTLYNLSRPSPTITASYCIHTCWW